jgi:O-antigen ligase
MPEREFLLARSSEMLSIVAGVSQSAELQAADVPSFTPPKWVSWLIAFVPIFPPLYLVAFGSFKLLRTLPLTARWVLFFFASTQLVAALFTPRPLLSLGLAAARTLLIFAMISAGVYLRDSRNLRPLLWGYAVVFISAWVSTLLTHNPTEILQGRLGHPYYYFVSLGLIAAVALWLQLDIKSRLSGWRILLLILTTITLLASGSRGPLLVFIIGSIVAAIFRHFQYLKGLIFILAALLIVTFVSPSVRQAGSLERLSGVGLTGRNNIWADALNAFSVSPIGGQGPYQSGPYLAYLYREPCQLTPTLESAGARCPEWLAEAKGAWSTAHNVVLHSLAETGVIGTLGLLLMIAWSGWLAFRSRQAFIVALFSGYAVMSMIDVVTAVPSPHFSELFWVVIGMAQATQQKDVAESQQSQAQQTSRPQAQAT